MAEDLRAAVAQIARWASVSYHGVQDHEIAFFINVVAHFSKLHEREKIDYLMPLRKYFEGKRDIIKEFLIRRYGSQAKLMANSIHMELYGKPWDLELEKKYFKDIYTAISEFALRHKEQVKAILRGMGFARAHTVISKMENLLLEDIQVGLTRMNDPKALKIVIQQRASLHNAFRVLFQSIEQIGKEMKLDPASLRADERVIDEFIKKVEPLVYAEIEAKEALLPAA